MDGVVEDCIVTSGGSIRIKQGMNGSGTLTARENIYSKFLENCTVLGRSFRSGRVPD